MPELETQTQTSDSGSDIDITADQILAGISDTHDDTQNRVTFPMEKAPEVKAKEAKPEVFTIEWNGKKKQVSKEEYAKFASDGFGRALESGKITKDLETKNTELATIQNQLKEVTEKLKRYDEVDKFIQTDQGKKWWEGINQSWGTREAPADASPVDKRILALENQLKETSQKLAEATTFIGEIKTERTNSLSQADDSKLEAAINEVKKSHEFLDWKTLDKNNRDLERQVLDHALENGIRSFRAALLDLKHDDIVAHSIQNYKKKEVESIRERAKKGIMLVSDKPIMHSPSDVGKSKSYDDLTAEALKEYAIN